ncbi:MAG: hypothetical protein LBN11_03220 [Tannerella sp.]|jgi:hypothetical protein|nr:hypothetical protein [Tannerella sp.]
MKTLRLFLSFAAVIFSTLVFTGCPADNEPDTVSVSPNAIEFAANIENAQARTVSVTTNLDSWDFYNTTSWIKADKNNEQTLSVSAISNNTSREPRTAEIRVRAGSAYDTLRVTQKGKPQDVINLSTPSLIFQATETGEKSVNVTTDAPSWKAEKSEPNGSSWLSIEKVDNTLKVRVSSENKETKERKAEIIFTGGDANPVTLTVIQEPGKPFIEAYLPLNFRADETTVKTITVNTNVADWNAISGASWVKINPNKNNSTVSVYVERNNGDARDANITFTADGAQPAIVKITQDGVTLSVNTTSLNFTYNATAAQTINVTTTATSWGSSKSANADWLKVTMYPSSNTISVAVDPNPTTSTRTANITVTAGTKSVTVIVSQDGKKEEDKLEVTPTSLTFVATPTATQPLTVTTNVSAGWNHSVSYTTGSGSGWIGATKSGNTLNVSATANATGAERTGSITFTAGSAPQVIVTVKQEKNGPVTLSVSPTSLSISATDISQKTLTVTTTASAWTYTNVPSWITATPSGNNILRVNAKTANPGAQRSGTITFNATGATPVNVTITQPGPCFGVMPYSSYNATGTQSGLLSAPGPGSWSGKITPICESQNYLITGWANNVFSLPAYCDYIGGEIQVDGDRKLDEDSEVEIYFKALVRNPSGGFYDLTDHTAKYNASTRILDFGDKLNGYDIMVGLAIIEKATGNLWGAIGDLYINAKLTLTPSTYSAPYNENTILKNAQMPNNLKITPIEGGSKVLKKISAKSLQK